MDNLIEIELDNILKPLKDRTKGELSTCSVANPKSNCVTFARNSEYLAQLEEADVKNVIVIVPKTLEIKSRFEIFMAEDVDLLFTLYHNYINRDARPKNDIISKSTTIHPSVQFTHGMKLCMYKRNKILFKHIGNVIIEDDVFIDANTVVHRGRLDSTIIKRGVRIGSLNNIAHNVTIGEDSVISTNSCIGGSCKIGKNCWIGLGTMIKSNLKICDNVLLGMGSIVTKDINKPGVYAGAPVKFIKEFDPDERGF